VRLVIFTTQFPPAIGGVETMMWQLAEHLVSKGVNVTVLAPELVGSTKFDSSQTLPIRRYDLGAAETGLEKGRQKINLIRTLRAIAQKSVPDAILCAGWDPCGYLASIAGVLWLRVPYYVMAYGMELMQLPSSFPARQGKFLLRALAFRRARRVFAISQFTQKHLIALGVPAQKISIIPPGIQALTGSALLNGLRNRTGSKILLTVARLVPRKGHDTVLNALPYILSQMPNVVYRIVGTGPESERLQDLSQTLGLGSHVEFCGTVSEDERERLLQECDLFVFPTRQLPTDFEGFGIAVLEAMQRGKPVVVTRAGAVPEMVQHGETGLIVEPDDPKALAAAILTLLQNPARALELGANARTVAYAKYRWDLIAERYLSEMTTALTLG
jgi:phosphatidylinositol alpha-1,6-mannosyltransferase